MENAFVFQFFRRDMQVHLVLDGAMVKNIEGHLAKFSLCGRPLFRETADREIILLGPWLVSPDPLDKEMLERCLDAARSAGKGVFWTGNFETEKLYKHLRHLNAARMPDGPILYFRHYDSDVLAAIIPLLDAQQASNFFGPAQAIALIGGDADGKSVEKPDRLPEAGSGPIAFQQWQIDRLDLRQEELSRRKIARYLREEFPNESAALSHKDIYNKVVVYQHECHAMNLKSEWSLAQYSRFNFESNDAGSKNISWRRKIATQLPPAEADWIFQRGMYDLRRTYRQKKSLENATALGTN